MYWAEKTQREILLMQTFDLQMEPALAEIRSRMLHVLDGMPGHEGMRSLLADVVNTPGKMIRTKLMLLAAGNCPPDRQDELLSTAAALELIHSSSLILDDLIDDSPLRRGRPTVQKQYGKPIAVCSGVYLLVTALAWLTDRGFTVSARELMDAVQATCDGEMIQHENRGNIGISTEAYFDAIRGKTACAFSTACKMACRIAGREERESRALEGFGMLIGIMFQLRDDLLDWTMEEAQLGKPVNEDFADGVYTLPTIWGFSDSRCGDRLRALAEKKEMSAQNLQEARRIVADAGGVAYTAAYLKKLGSQADALLDILPDDGNTDAMRALVRLLEVECK